MKRLLFFLLAWLMVANVALAQGNAAPEPALTITAQPVAISIAKKDQSVTLSFIASKGESEIAYQWYQNAENTNSGGEAINGATASEFTTEVFYDREIRYYYCIAMVGDESVTSNVAVVAHTGLPTIYVNTGDVVHQQKPIRQLYNSKPTFLV